jgi:hypothetical protein
MATYSKGAGKAVKEALHEMKEGKLESGRGGKKVTSGKQAIAIGLSEAREKGARVPPKASSAKKSATKKSSTGKKSAAKKGATKNSSEKKSSAKKGAAKKSTTKKTSAGKKRSS